jgi:tetratricopeptide (TPR) repeat protein
LAQGDGDADASGLILRAIEFSHAKLDPATQQTLELLAPFTGVINTQFLEQYATVWNTANPDDPVAAQELVGAVEGLVEVGLASRIDPMYVQLQPVFPYFIRNRRHTNPTRRHATDTTHAEHYQGLAGAIHQLLVSRTPDERRLGQHLARLEYANLRIALDHRLHQQLPARALTVCLDEHLDQARQQDTRYQLLDHIAGLLNNRTDTPGRQELANVSHLLGIVAQYQRRFDEAETHYRKALELNIEFNDRHNQASTYHQLGIVAQYQRRFEEAETHYRKALELKIEFNDRHSQAITYHQLGIMAQAQRRFDEAETHYRKALELFIEFNDRHNQANTMSQLGILLTDASRVDEAIPLSLQALAVRSTAGESTGLDLRQLKKQQQQIGQEAFEVHLDRLVDPASKQILLAALAQLDDPGPPG